MSEHKSPPPQRPDDDELEAFLSRRSDLSQQYRDNAASERAPPALDQAVRAYAAREHAQSAGFAGRLLRWRMPLAAAASLVLTIGVLRLALDLGTFDHTPASPAVADDLAAAPVPTAAPAPPSPAAPAAGMEKSAEAVIQAKPMSAAPSPPLAKSQGPAAVRGEAQQKEAGSVANTIAAADGAASRDATPANEPGAPAESAPAANAAKMVASQQARTARQEQAPVVANAPVAVVSPSPEATEAAPAAAASPAAAAPPVARMAMKTVPVADVASGSLLKRCAESNESDLDHERPAYPVVDRWLGAITRLHDQQQDAAAREQLLCLRRVYPQAAVGDALMEILKR